MFPKKKPGIDVTVAVGKPKAGPPPLDTPGKRPAPPMEEEASEAPAEESGEDYSATLASDIIAPLVDLGIDDDTAKSVMADCFERAAKCLRGKQAEADAGEMPAGEGEYGQ